MADNDDKGYSIDIEVGPQRQLSPRLEAALVELAKAVADDAADAEVSGYVWDPAAGGQTGGLEIGILRTGGGKFGPAQPKQVFCVGFSYDWDTGEKSCGIYI